MATGGGKTLLMHINYWQILKYSKNNWDNIILITPNEGLSKQHYEELKLSGIPSKLHDGNIDNLKTKDGEILIIDIHKLTEEKKGEGVSVDISYFDGKNLVFIDEGHKGQKSEEQKWKKLREEIGKSGFLFEYSATFGQAIEEKDKDLLEEYAKAIIFDYSYKYFYTDGYGKDFYVYNIQAKQYSEEQQSLLFTAGLLSFYEQLVIFENHREELKEYNIEKPLWIFVGSTVIKKKNSKNFSKSEKETASDVEKVILFFKKICENEEYLKENVKKILEGKSGLIDGDGNDIFKGKFEFIVKLEIDTLIEDIYQKVFGGKGKLELYEIKNADGEIGLKISTTDKYFGVINVGDVESLKKLISESEIEVKEDHFSQSLFFGINEGNSSINILIGSKKFIEGWNSWRVSNMGLINIGKGEGPQIIQLFGRGVRLKGKDYSLKREENSDYKLKVLQTLFIFGLNADYINKFLTMIEKEDLDYEDKEIEIPIKSNMTEKWEEKIYTIKTKDDFDFAKFPVKLMMDKEILKNVKIDLRPKITASHGLQGESVHTVIDEPLTIPKEYFEFIDWNFLYSEIINFKIAKGMYNLIVDTNAIMQIVKSNAYRIFLSETEGISIEKNGTKFILKIYSFEGIRKFHDIILMILKDYIQRFYVKEEKRKAMGYLEVEPLTINNHPSMYPEDKKIILKFPKKLASEIQEVINQLEEFNNGKLPDKWKNWDSFIIHLDNHLYTPLIIWKENKEEINSIPVRLNEGETKFLVDFKNFLGRNSNLLENYDIFLLRNLSKRGIGFFISSGFYPDFIVWIVKENKQHIIFIDPKGIRNLGNFNDDKIQLCVSYIKDIEKKISEELKSKGEKVNLQLDAFILSISNYDDIKGTFGEGNHTREDFENHNVVFQEDAEYLEKIFEKIGAIKIQEMKAVAEENDIYNGKSNNKT